MPNKSGIRKVRAGDQWPGPAKSATFHNATVDAIQAARAGVLGPLGGAHPSGSIVRVKNTTGNNLDRFAVLGYGDDLIDQAANLAEWKRHIVLEGVTPTTADHYGRFVILLAPLKPDASGLAMIAGVTRALIDVTDADHEFADVKDGSTGSLESASSGYAHILQKPSGTGLLWCTVRIGGASAMGPATIIRALVDEASGVEPTDGTFDVDGVSILAPNGATDYPGGSAPTSVENFLGFPAEDNAPVIAFYDPAAGAWLGIPRLYFGPCTSPCPST